MKFQVTFKTTNQTLTTDFDNVQYVTNVIGQESLDYSQLKNKPTIESVTLEGDKSFTDLGLTEVSNQEILEIANRILGGE